MLMPTVYQMILRSIKAIDRMVAIYLTWINRLLEEVKGNTLTYKEQGTTILIIFKNLPSPRTYSKICNKICLMVK